MNYNSSRLYTILGYVQVYAKSLRVHCYKSLSERFGSIKLFFVSFKDTFRIPNREHEADPPHQGSKIAE